MTDKLSLYNGALALCGENELGSLTENVPARKKLDNIWDRDAVDTILQLGSWNFAIRSISPAYSASITPAFGYSRAFEKPTDFIRTAGVCSDEYFKNPITAYTDETGYWFSDLDVIYVRYVSNDSQYGGDYSQWPPNFTRMAEAWLARQVAPRLGVSSEKRAEIKEEFKEAKLEAENTDAMEEPAQFAPEGTWSRSRRGRRSGRDRGSRSTLIG